MKFVLIVIGLYMTSNVCANREQFEIKIGAVTLSGKMPSGRTSRAPDIPYKKHFDLCDWLDEKDNQKHNAQDELLRKVWEFKRFFKAPTGSLVFSISIVRVHGTNNNLASYYKDVAEATLKNLQEMSNRGYTDHEYSPAEGYKELYIDGHLWMRYVADSNTTKYYRTFIGNELVLRLNFIQSDSRKNAVKGQWHPEAEKMAKRIIESIELSLPSDGKLCN